MLIGNMNLTLICRGSDAIISRSDITPKSILWKKTYAILQSMTAWIVPRAITFLPRFVIFLTTTTQKILAKRCEQLSGRKPELLQEIIGHADYSTTANIYIHNNLEQLKEAINQI